MEWVLNKINWRIRNWEEQGKYPAVTDLWTRMRLSVSNARDATAIRRVARAIRTGHFPETAEDAVHEVCSGNAGAGIRPMQLEPELTELIRIIENRRPKRLLEIGTARGGTLCLFCRFAAPDATIVSVDLPYGRNGGGYPRWKERHYRSFTRRHQTLHLIRANSHAAETVETVRELINGSAFDFILIDADHSYEGVKTDYHLYAPLIAPGGLIALHDVLPNLSDPSIDVNRFWNELENDGNVRTETLTSRADQRAFGIGLIYK